MVCLIVIVKEVGVYWVSVWAFYFCKPPRVTMTDLDGHINYTNEQHGKQKEIELGQNTRQGCILRMP